MEFKGVFESRNFEKINTTRSRRIQVRVGSEEN
jgi:hypothetical protein